MKILERITNRVQFPRQKSMLVAGDDLTDLEAKLEEVLVPIVPRAEFVNRLNQQLVRTGFSRSLPTVAAPNNKTRVNVLLGTASVLSGAVLFFSGVRTLITLFGMICILYQLSRESKEKRARSRPHPAT
ncbi:MAG: hypothetical protein ACE5GO_06335 [Anaerolineales bacterium]